MGQFPASTTLRQVPLRCQDLRFSFVITSWTISSTRVSPILQKQLVIALPCLARCGSVEHRLLDGTNLFHNTLSAHSADGDKMTAKKEKPMKRIMFAIALLVALAFGELTSGVLAAQPDIGEFFDRFTAEWVRADPQLATTQPVFFRRGAGQAGCSAHADRRQRSSASEWNVPAADWLNCGGLIESGSRPRNASLHASSNGSSTPSSEPSGSVVTSTCSTKASPDFPVRWYAS